MLRERDELGGCQQAALGVRPADQRLHSDHRPGGEVDGRLVVEDELAALDGAPQVRTQPEALRGRLVHRWLEHPIAGLAGGLGFIHGDIGSAQHVSGSRQFRRAEGDADAGADEQRPIAQVEGRLELGQHSFRDADRLFVVDVLQEQRELVAAEARGGVARPDGPRQATGDLADEVVSLSMAERVVHRLEVIEVEEEHRHALRVPATSAEGVLEPIDEQLPVRKARQRVVKRLAGQLLFELLPLADVVHGQHDASHAWVVAKTGGKVDGQEAPIPVADLGTRGGSARPASGRPKGRRGFRHPARRRGSRQRGRAARRRRSRGATRGTGSGS